MLVEKDSLITKDEEIANILNDHYINIVEKSSGINQVKQEAARLDNWETGNITALKTHPKQSYQCT